MILSIILLVIALGIVAKSADWFLGSAEKVGVSLGLPAFVLGVVLVGFGTSLPELTTSIAAVIDGAHDVTIANVAGSNIANILIIIGVSTLFLGTMKFKKNIIDLDLPLLVSTTAIFSILLVDGSIGKSDGFILLAGFVGYILYSLVYKEDKEYKQGLITLVSDLSKNSEERVEQKKNIVGPFTIVGMLASVILLGGSAKVAVDSLLVIVEETNIAVDTISFFALAIGTSLPELVVSIKAHRKGQGDIVVGNIVGSCMFNILFIVGIASMLGDQVMSPGLVTWSIIGMALSVLLLVIGSITRRIHLWEGYSYVLLYIAISTYIIKVS